MTHIVLANPCACATKHATPAIESFDDYEEAMEFAHAWAERLNHAFCGKHGFDVIEVDEHFVIDTQAGGFCESCDI
ncbi:MAG: hypothetical protein KU37_07010 [Sulfuricurvum sp. PC08-66]|nr:MAG: hypothetical protein KU37_07010 [Sulfuricurvum sp. PC08-66]